LNFYKRGDILSSGQAQDLAVQVARGGKGFVAPNPLVGCVVVDSAHRFLASGFHAKWGGPHAEAHALSGLQREELQGATIYVTLEPCTHYGKTPPCVELLLDKGIRKVVVGLQDPNPLVAGKGITKLKENKIEVEQNLEFSQKCERLTEIFLWHIQNKMPFVALKVAMSLDGQIAMKSGESQWITGEAARLRAREIRAGYDATMIGAETFLKDNPRLDFRETVWEKNKTSRVVILDPRGRAEEFYPRSELAKTTAKENVFFVKMVETKTLQDLYQKGLTSIYVEGGAQTHSLFIKQKLFQKIYCFQAPQILGQGRAWTGELEFNNLAATQQLDLESCEKIDKDLLLQFYPK
jgi:diaminohydroxyphosphoribosylaminopyrimidine deaminase / 5-amino-6-(5-phosphoribosylamino)uracil reductase